MKIFRFSICIWLLPIFLCASIARAQTPLPAPKTPDSQTRQKLRTAILQTLSEVPTYDTYTRQNLALPLAQVGDWDTALRLLKDNVRGRDELWHWRAIQLAQAGKWRQVRAAAARIEHAPTHADALLFAAREAIDRGVMLGSPLENSNELKLLLLSASPVLKKSDNIPQRAYSAYLWARGGDLVAAKRVFARVIEDAKKADAAAVGKINDKKIPKSEKIFLATDHLRNVLLMEARAGLLMNALQHAENADDYLLGWWIPVARTNTELAALQSVIENLPLQRRVTLLFQLSMAMSARGNKTAGRDLFERARQLAETLPATSDKRKKYLPLMSAFYAAHFLQDADSEKQTGDELRAVARQDSSSNSSDKQFLAPEEIDMFPILLDLKADQMLGDAGAPVSPARLEEIAMELQKTPPSELQFRALETVAGMYFLQKQDDKLKSVAQVMLQSARVLEIAERKKRAEKAPSPFNPYWPRSPFVLSAVFWLQRAGDDETATTFAREFSRNVPEREKPYAAMALFQLGFPDLADSVFDPVQEIPRVAKTIRENQKTKQNFDWNLFQSWNEFASSEARYRSPDAPFRWFGKLDNNARVSVLRDWIAALNPPPVQKPPFVNVTLGRSSNSM